MPHVIVDLTITPLGTASPSVSQYVAAAEAILDQYPNIQRRLNPMSTTLEGELDDILTAIRQMHEAPFAQGALRVSTALRIDDRRDGHPHTMSGKVASVKTKLGE